MKSIVELLYNQTTEEWHPDSCINETEYLKAMDIRTENVELLIESLNAEQKKWFDGFSNADIQLNGMTQFQHFYCGFHLGAQLTLEIIQGREELLGDNQQ